MPKGPQGQKRKADVIGNAVHVMRIATGQEKESARGGAYQEGPHRHRQEGGGAAMSKSITRPCAST